MNINPHVFEKNLEALASHRPELKKRVEQAQFPDWIAYRRLQNWYSGVFKFSEDKTITLFDQADPEEACRSLAKDHSFAIGESTFLFGMGLGYFPLEIWRRKPESHHLVIIEKYFDVFIAALHHIDMGALISDSFTHFYFGDEISDNRLRHQLAFGSVGYKARWAIGYSCCFDEDYYSSAKEKIEHLLTNYTADVEFLKNLGPDVTVNVIRNMRDVMFSASAMALKGQFKDVPAVVIGAGPSLGKNVLLLSEVVGKGIIVCCDTSLALLAALGIAPHFVVSLDYRQANFSKFENVPISPLSGLVYNSQVYPENLGTSLGPHFVLGCAYQTQAWLDRMLEWEESYPSTSNVGKMAYDLAEHLGCSPIVLIGMDHALETSKAHAPMAWEEDLQDYKDLVKVDYLEKQDIFGQPVQTTIHLVMDNWGMGELIENRDNLVINGSEGGLPIKGTRAMRFQDAVTEFFHTPLQRDIFKEISRLHDTWPRVRPDLLLSKFHEFAAKLEMVTRHCNRIVPAVNGLQESLEQEGPELSPQFHGKSAKLSELTKLSLSPEWQEVTGVMSQALLDAHFEKRDYLYTKDTQENAKERVEEELNAAQKIFSRVREVTKIFAKEWNDLTGWLEQVAAAESLIDERDDDLRGVAKLVDLGCYRQAFRYMSTSSGQGPSNEQEFQLLSALFDRCGSAWGYLELHEHYGQRFHPNGPETEAMARNEKRQQEWTATEQRILREVSSKDLTSVPFSWTAMAEFYLKVREFEMATSVVDTALELEPDDAELLFLRAALHETRGEHLEAVTLLERVLSLSPHMKKAYNLLALVSNQLEDFELTEEILALGQGA